MAIARYEPWSVFTQLNQLNDRINRLFDAQVANASNDSSAATADWVPPADIAEFKDRFVLRFDVPGVNTESIDITLEQGVLTVSGVRERDTQSDEVERIRLERPAGRFHRRFTLPDTVDTNAVQAKGRNGVLEVVIPKQPKAQPRRISVAAG
jgi:HSP20 family protein